MWGLKKKTGWDVIMVFLQMLRISEDCSNNKGGENRQKIIVSIKKNLLCFCFFFFLQKKAQILI